MNTKPTSMFTDAEFASLRKFFMENRLELANPTNMRAEMIKLDKFIDEELLTKTSKDQVEEVTMAINITLQGRNFMARMLSEPERPMPEVKGLVVVPDPIQSRHVAVWGGTDNSTPANAVSHVLKTILDQNVRCKVYTNLNVLIGAVLNSELCGIASISPNEKEMTRIEPLVRHHLKGMRDWNYEKAEALVLPPCADFVHLSPMVTCMGEMLAGTFRVSDKYDLVGALPSLLTHMYVPSTNRTVVVVDDKPAEVAGIYTILAVCPKVKLVKVMHPGSEFAWGNDVVLLDEDMGKIKGSDIAKEILRQKPKVTVASITGGSRPSYAKHHFQAKTSIAKDKSAAEGFVKFMSAVLREADQQ